MEVKDLILVVGPNDSDIADAVRSWEERGYTIQTHVIDDLKTVVEDLMYTINRNEKVRIVFLESSWGSIPTKDLVYLQGRLRIEPKVKWQTLLKKD